MTKLGETSDLLKCNFCGKSQKQVIKLIAGPSVYICNECIELCNEIIEEELGAAAAKSVEEIELPKPREIKSSLDEYVIGQDQAKKALGGKVIILGNQWPTSIADCLGNDAKFAHRGLALCSGFTTP